MPNGAIISPPDSASDDDDLPEVRVRRIENLKELHDAVSQIPQQRSRLPASRGTDGKEVPDAGDLLVLPTQAEGMHHSFSTGSLDRLAGGHRRFAHVRSATEPHISVGKSVSSSATGSEEDSDEERRYKPQMVRKKSGELVRPALRPASRRRPSSMPGTPTFSKAVHFDSHLEHVRHFLQVDRPLAVSAGSSPVDNYESDTEYPFLSDEGPGARVPPFEWEIIVSNFPVETPVRKALPVRLERVWLSNDQKSLIGSVAVANLAFQKLVACRFTLDYWKTTSEVAAEYVCEIRPAVTPHGRDRFNFTIQLSDLVNLESKTLYFCVRYNVKGQEYWDNNNGMNFQVDFRKKMLPRHGKKGVIGAASRPFNGLPKSNRRPGLAAGQKSKPAATASDEFGDSQKPNFNRSIHEYLGESGPAGLKLKAVRSTGDLPSDNLSKRLSGPSGQFALRYDFGDSLSRAIYNAKNEMAAKSDALYMKPNKRTGSPTSAKPDTQNKSQQAPTNAGPAVMSPAESPRTSISSASYEEIVNKWCFFGTKQKSSQPKGTASEAGRFELGDDVSTGTASYEGSPVQMGNYHHSHVGTQHHSLHPRDPNPYFSHAPVFGAVGASPAEPPLEKTSPLPPSQVSAAPGQAPGISAQPQTPSGNAAPAAGTSMSPNEYIYQRSRDRFPFHGSETYAPAAIRG